MPRFPLSIYATAETLGTGHVDLEMDGRRVARHDLVVGPIRSVTIPARGAVRGRVTDAAGVPRENARVSLSTLGYT